LKEQVLIRYWTLHHATAPISSSLAAMDEAAFNALCSAASQKQC